MHPGGGPGLIDGAESGEMASAAGAWSKGAGDALRDSDDGRRR